MYLSYLLADSRNASRLPAQESSLTTSLSTICEDVPWIAKALRNDCLITPHFLQKAALMVELYDLMKWLDNCRPLAVEDCFDQVPVGIAESQNSSVPQNSIPNVGAQANIQIQDHILTQISKFLRSNPWDCITQFAEFFKDQDYATFVASMASMLMNFASVPVKSVIISVVFYGILSVKARIGSDESIHGLAEFFSKHLLDLVDSRHRGEEEAYCNQVLTTFFSTISSKDWLKACFGDSQPIDDEIFQGIPFYYDDEELYTPLFVANRWGLVPLIKKMADSSMPGNRAMTRIRCDHKALLLQRYHRGLEQGTLHRESSPSLPGLPNRLLPHASRGHATRRNRVQVHHYSRATHDSVEPEHHRLRDVCKDQRFGVSDSLHITGVRDKAQDDVPRTHKRFQQAPLQQAEARQSVFKRRRRVPSVPGSR